MQRMKKGLGRPLLSASAKSRLDARFKGKMPVVTALLLHLTGLQKKGADTCDVGTALPSKYDRTQIVF